jgi:acyl carrier protein
MASNELPSLAKCRIIHLFAHFIHLKKQNKMADILARITPIIVEKLGVDAADVTTEASFSNDLSADSLDMVELIMDIEKEFEISIPDEEAEKLQTVGEAVAYLEQNAA